MRIVEPIMRPGKFDGELVPTTPVWIRDRLDAAKDDRNGFVVVFKTRRRAPALADARYTGWLTKRSNAFEVSGIGLAALLQADTGIGDYNPETTDTNAGTLTEYIDALLHGGLTRGTVTLTGLSTVDELWPAGLGAREFLDLVCRRVGGARYRVNPDGSIDAATRDILFTDPPAVYVSDRLESSTIFDGVRIVKGAVSRFVSDASQVSSRTIGFGRGEGGSIETDTSPETNVAEGNRQHQRPVDPDY